MSHAPPNAFYAQSGGVTAVINASACGVLQAARRKRRIRSVYVGRNGILGALREEMVDTARLSPKAIGALRHAPGGAFGSCRHKLEDPERSPDEFRRLLEVFAAHDIGHFLYNGGGDSQDTAWKLARYSEAAGYPLRCVGIPKTIDNDLPLTDNCPGYGSAAKYLAASTLECGIDVASMSASSTKVFVLEVMGRHAGWLAAATGLAARAKGQAPQLILLPEIPYRPADFLRRVEQSIQRWGHCVVVVSEGLRDGDGALLAAGRRRDDFGHAQLGGVAPLLAAEISQALNAKCHWAVADYMQRAARHLASATDVRQAYALGQAAVDMALDGPNAVMATIVRDGDAPYRWRIGAAPLSAVANVERCMPRDYISQDGYGITDKARRYMRPLISGEDYPPYRDDGLPDYPPRIEAPAVRRRLPAWSP